MTFIETFEKCSHEERCQVGTEVAPIVRTESRGPCFWCVQRELDREANCSKLTNSRF